MTYTYENTFYSERTHSIVRERESARERERDTVLLNIFRVENKIRELAN